MFYYVVKQPTKYHQMTLEEFLSSDYVVNEYETQRENTNTRVYEVKKFSTKVANSKNISEIIDVFKNFNNRTQHLHIENMQDLYHQFFIPKRSGGLRKINAPNDELMAELRNLKFILENTCGALYHTSAFAYISNRSTIDSVKRHQANESRWFLKLDLSDFFGSTTLDFTMKMLGMIYPFSEIVKSEEGKNELRKAISLGFLDGGLPQGTPLSPTLTNIIMIPIDYTLFNACRKSRSSLVYTRYADDFLISSKYSFKFRDVEKMVIEILNSFEAPFKLNTKKTRYGSSAGSNWNLGVMLNKDNNITIGYKNKKRFEAMLFNFAMDYINGNSWQMQEIQHMTGLISYYKMIEGENIDKIIEHISKKVGSDIKGLIKTALLQN